MHFTKLIKKDFHDLFRNKRFIVSLIVIIIIPLLYSLLYLDAFWDPYKRLSDVPIAVVNLDKGIDDDGYINYGDTIIEELKDSDEIGWTMTSYDEAQRGLEAKEGFYAAVIIPADFSASVTSAKNGTPEQATLLFIENQKKNFIQTQINSSLILRLKETLSRSITENYLTVTFDSLDSLKDGMTKAADGSNTITEGLKTADEGSNSLTNGLNDAKSATEKISDGMVSLKNGTAQASEGSDKLAQGIAKFNTQAIYPMGLGIAQLTEGFNGKLLPAAKQLQDGSQALASGLSKASASASQLQGGADQLVTAVQQTNGLKNGSKQLSYYASQLSQGATQLSQAGDALQSGSEQISTGAATLTKGLDAYIKAVSQSQTAIENATDTYLSSYLSKHPEAMKDPDMQNYLATLTKLSEASHSTTNTLQVTALQSGAKDLAESTSRYHQGTASLFKGITSYAESAVSYATATLSYANGAEQYASGAADFADGAVLFSDGVSSAIPGSQTLAQGTAAFYDGLDKQLGANLNTINESMSRITENATLLETSSLALSQGLMSINDGVNALADGTKKLENGMSELVTGSQTLSNGLNEIYEGSKTLSEKLDDGSTQLNDSLKNGSKQMSTFIADPLIIEQKKENPVSNYGTGFTPYFIALSLWVGAILIFFIVPFSPAKNSTTNTVALILGKYIINSFIGILQALIVSVVVLLLGLKPTSTALFLLTNVLMSLVFVAIVQCFIYCFKDAGRVLAMVLLILQLTSCGGTFPIEVVPAFFKRINPFMPFTYTVSALREIISGIDYSILETDYMILGFILLSSLLINIVIYHFFNRPSNDSVTDTNTDTFEVVYENL